MESLGALAMVTALAWPLIGGAVTGIILGLVRRHGLVGTLLDAIAGGIVGYGLFMGAMLLPLGDLPPLASLAMSVGLPILGGLIGVGIKSRFA